MIVTIEKKYNLPKSTNTEPTTYTLILSATGLMSEIDYLEKEINEKLFKNKQDIK